MIGRGLLSLFTCVSAVLAQSRAPRSTVNPAQLREELKRVQAQQERLVHLRIRHDLGLPVQADSYLALSESERARTRADAEQQLADEESRVAALNDRMLELGAKLAKAATTASQAPVDPDLDFGGPTLTPPTAGEPFTVAADEHQHVAAAPASEPAPHKDASPAVLLRGSQDHSRVGRALYQAKKFDRARTELEQAVAKRKDLVDLFYLARSCEALGDGAKASELYLQVETLDSKQVDGAPQRGEWARAARVARLHMEWTQNQGTWKPQPSVESVQWRKK